MSTGLWSEVPRSGAGRRGPRQLSIKRVVAVAPVVIDLLNVEEVLRAPLSCLRLLGAGDRGLSGIRYYAPGQERPELAALLKIEDPYAYRDRLTMPKFIINSAGDQYFLPTLRNSISTR